MSGWRDLVPVPLAAPETPMLRASRMRVIAGCATLAVVVLFFAELRALAGPFALPLFAALATFLVAEGWSWVKAKNAADDAWLMRGRADDDAA